MHFCTSTERDHDAWRSRHCGRRIGDDHGVLTTTTDHGKVTTTTDHGKVTTTTDHGKVTTTTDHDTMS
jgi:hypothetical protein